MSDQVLSALEQFFFTLAARWRRKAGGCPLCDWEADWRSPCELDEPREGRVAWRPFQSPWPSRLHGHGERPGADPASQRHRPVWPLVPAAPLSLLFQELLHRTHLPWNDADLDLLKRTSSATC